MHISRMLMLISAVLLISGLFDRALERAGSNKLEALFFLLGTASLDRFVLEQIKGTAVSPACIFTLAAALYIEHRPKGRKRLKPLRALLALAFGTAAAPLMALESEWACYAAAVIFASAALVFEAATALAISFAASLFACAAAQIYAGFEYGIMEIEIGDACLAVQMASLLTVLTINEFISDRTKVRNRSYERPIN